MGLSGSDDSSSERTGTDLATKCDTVFATPFSAHLCRIHAHSLRILCAFYAFSELSAKCSGCTGLRTEPLGLAWLSTEMLHLLCILRAFTNPNAECVPNARECTQNGTG